MNLNFAAEGLLDEVVLLLSESIVTLERLLLILLRWRLRAMLTIRKIRSDLLHKSATEDVLVVLELLEVLLLGLMLLLVDLLLLLVNLLLLMSLLVMLMQRLNVMLHVKLLVRSEVRRRALLEVRTLTLILEVCLLRALALEVLLRRSLILREGRLVRERS